MYNELSHHFIYDESSPSYLSTINGRHVGYKRKDKNGNELYWRTMKCSKSLFVHRIIWTIKNGPIPDEMVINHIDNNGLNNCISNLEVCTPTENNRRTKMHTGRGLRKDNELSVTGVKIITSKGYKYTVARLRFNKILYEKLFSHLKYSLEESILLASEWRNNKIREFNIIGAGFSYENKELVDSIKTTKH